ncbi:MAG: YggS family pyridoxal phosphate-dependent enzyme [Alphaproteobacteria bacterium]|nr:YggS family pyridoxal phosphate-dependent enzyme [Alphaproteobacteria bacterium]
MSVLENLKDVRQKIENAAKASGRSPSAVALIAVSKMQPEAKIEEALAAGQRVFGENRVQEAQTRWAQRRAEFSDLRLHLIGPLQTNKVKEAVALFDVIETLDREKLARALSLEMKKQGRFLPCFIQVNTGDEPQKAGISPVDLKAFYGFCVEECGLDVRGLMCIPPVEDPPALHFCLLRQYAAALGLTDLSMGMSADFEKAIGAGANFVRVGSGVFGDRLV